VHACAHAHGYAFRSRTRLVIFANYTSWPKAAIIMPVKRKILENLSLPGGLFFHRVVTPRTLEQRWISSRLNRVIRRKVVVVIVVVVVVVVMTPTYATASNSGALEGARASAKLIRDNSSVAALIFYVTEQPIIPPCHSYRPINRSMTTLVYQCLAVSQGNPRFLRKSFQTRDYYLPEDRNSRYTHDARRLRANTRNGIKRLRR